MEEKIGDSVYFLSEYNWLKATLRKVNRKTYTLFVSRPGFLATEKKVSKDKCAFQGEQVCIVWETWKGVNGRGGYRVERIKYPQDRISAELIPYQGDWKSKGRVTE